MQQPRDTVALTPHLPTTPTRIPRACRDTPLMDILRASSARRPLIAHDAAIVEDTTTSPSHVTLGALFLQCAHDGVVTVDAFRFASSSLLTLPTHYNQRIIMYCYKWTCT